MAMSWNDYHQKLNEINYAGGVDEATRDQQRKRLYEAYTTPSSFDMGEFEGLLGKLESSKMKQKSQAAAEERRSIMAGGLAGMMNNF